MNRRVIERSNIELFEIANLQLLKLRILDFQLDARLEKSVELLKRREQKLLFRSRRSEKTIKEIVPDTDADHTGNQRQ